MSANVNVTPVGPPTGTSGTGAAAPAASSSGGSGYTMSTTISSIADLQQKAPKVYNAMMEGIASVVINQMQDKQNEIHMMNIEAEAELEGDVNG